MSTGTRKKASAEERKAKREAEDKARRDEAIRRMEDDDPVMPLRTAQEILRKASEDIDRLDAKSPDTPKATADIRAHIAFNALVCAQHHRTMAWVRKQLKL